MAKKKVVVRNIQTYHKLKKQQKNFLKQRKEQAVFFIASVKDLIDDYGEQIDSDFRFTKACDFVQKIISERYPEAEDVWKTPTFLISSQEMNQIEELENCGGCYVPDLKIILIKDNNSNKKNTKKYKDKVSKLFAKYTLSADEEDVFVHELLHAVSHAANRRSRKFSHLEEEFVYKSTIDWFRSRGIGSEEIVENNFLPFVIHDVLKNEKVDILLDIAKKENVSVSQEQITNADFMCQFANAHAKEFVSEVVRRARELGLSMIESPSNEEVEEDNRFSCLDLS